MPTSENKSLGDEVRELVARKFGECEAQPILITHDRLRRLIADFAIAWINAKGLKPSRPDDQAEKEER